MLAQARSSSSVTYSNNSIQSVTFTLYTYAVGSDLCGFGTAPWMQMDICINVSRLYFLKLFMFLREGYRLYAPRCPKSYALSQYCFSTSSEMRTFPTLGVKKQVHGI